MDEFEREERYIVIKRSDISKFSSRGITAMFQNACRKLHDTILRNGAPARRFLVIESDWPEYEPTWAAIERRMTGKPAPEPQVNAELLAALERTLHRPLIGNPSHQELVAWWEYEKAQGNGRAEDQLFALAAIAKAKAVQS